MEKRKWLWKRKSSERSPGETESSGSISSHSERFSDDQEVFKVSPNNNTQSPEVSSKALVNCEDINDSVRSLTEKLSAALVNVSAKEDLVKQHAKVAEEAIAGWENAENEVVELKKKLEAATQENSALEDRVSHLDGALKECVRQLRQAREEQEQKIQEAVAKAARDWETTKFDLESQLIELQNKEEAVKSEPPTHYNPEFCHKIDALERENSSLKLELLSQSEELEIRTTERDLSTQAAETASKQHLESIKKVARLEAECRRLKAIASKASSVSDHKSAAASSIYVDSFTDSQSDSGERLNSVDVDTQKARGLEVSKGDPSVSDSWASALIAELDQFKNEKVIDRNLPAPSIEIDLMDDFLEMERLAALHDIKNDNHKIESKSTTPKQTNDVEISSLKAELEAMIHRASELEEKLEKIEAEKAELEIALAKSQESMEASELQLRETETKLEELQRELCIANESKQLLESQLISMEAETRTMSAKIDSLSAEVQSERALSVQITTKCQELEKELLQKNQEAELQQTTNSKVELKIKQEDLDVAAGKLAECQNTIASLGKQLKSLATLEDFLIDTASIPEFSARGSLISKAGGEPWKLHSNETFSLRRGLDAPGMMGDNSGPSVNKNNVHSLPSSSSSAVSSNHVSSEKNRNGFAKFFTRSKNGIQLEI